MLDVLVIGCGIVGAAAAMELSKYQLQVAVLEKENDVANGTTKANSAILHAGYDPLPGTPDGPAECAWCGAGKTAVRTTGCALPSVRLSGAGVQPGRVRHPWRPLRQRGEANGVPGLQVLTGDEARAMDPQLSDKVQAALYAPTAAICSPGSIAWPWRETAVRNGAQLHLETQVTGMEKLDEGWLVHTDQGILPPGM